MHTYPYLSVALFFFSTALSLAGTPRTPWDFFERGQARYQKGDLQGAIADFTQALDLSSRLDEGAVLGANKWKSSADSWRSEPEQDPGH